jgi:hypothetical protein
MVFIYVQGLWDHARLHQVPPLAPIRSSNLHAYDSCAVCGFDQK